MMMQADHRRLMLLWLSLMLLLIPLSSLQAQTATPVSTNTETRPASPIDDALLRRTVDNLIDAQVEALMVQMGVEDKVGQLFLIHFSGNETGIESDIAVFVHAYRIGGVVMSPSHRNFTNERGVNTPAEAAGLANRLQALAYGRLLPVDEELLDGSLMDNVLMGNTFSGEMPRDGVELSAFVDALPTLADAAEEADRPPQNIPLFIAVEQLGDELAVTSLRRRFTDLPNQMTLGATWDPDLAREIGAVVGQELAAAGVNVVLGPALDVYVQPRPDSVGKLGIHMYGGNPDWVSQFGQSYIAGIHRGSDGQVLTVARHFPGQGDVDRLPDHEVATVQGDIEELRYKSLGPFSAVTGSDRTEVAAVDDPSVTDMMMSSHMRFSSVQPTGPARVPPISLSPDLTTLLEDEGFGPWMESGLIMSNALGALGIQHFYETDEGEFPARQVAKDAFGAGNDILYLGHITGNGDWEEERVNIESTISFFQEKYKDDLGFADQVDESLRRILRTKVRLYADMDALEEQARAMLTAATLSDSESITDGLIALSTPSVGPISSAPDEPLMPLTELLTPRQDLDIFEAGSDHGADADAIVRQIARDSLTVLYPDITGTSGALPQPPKAGDDIVIITESRLEQECSDCTAEVAVGPDDVENIILRLYGPDATGQISPEQLTSLTFSELIEVLDTDKVNAEDASEDAGEIAARPSLLPTPESPAAAEDEISEGDVLTGTVAAETAEMLDRTGQMDRQIDDADWLIFAMLNVGTESDPNSDAVKRFLRERSEQLENKQVVVLALHAPYFLDSTEISALTSYLGVYSKSQPFLENAVRAIFRDYTPHGAPPVNVPGTRFASLENRLQPDPARKMEMSVSTADGEVLSAEADADADAQPSVAVGETIRIQVGPIFDRNGHNVPDNTRVEFQIFSEGDEMALNVEPAVTHSGIVVRDILLERGGALRISASSGEATTGDPFPLVVLDVNAESAGGAVDAQSTGSDTGQGISSSPEEPDAGAPNSGDSAPSNVMAPGNRVNPATLIIALFTLIGTLSLLLIVQIRILPRPTLVHNMLWTVIVGLVAYVAYGVGLLPGANVLHQYFDLLAAALVVFVGMVGTMLWLQLRSD